MSPPHVNTGDLSGSDMTSDLKGITLCFIMTFPVVVVVSKLSYARCILCLNTYKQNND